jgi:hypothetical protein
MTSERLTAKEKCTHTLFGTLKDEDGEGIDPVDLTSVKATLYNDDDAAKTLINSRDAQEVLLGVLPTTTGELTVATGGAFVFRMKAADFVMTDPKRGMERHMLRLDYTHTHSAGARTGSDWFLICVENVPRRT